jgi:hypothetical protein
MANQKKKKVSLLKQRKSKATKEALWKAVRVLRKADIDVIRIAPHFSGFTRTLKKVQADTVHIGDKADFGSLEDGWNQTDGKDKKLPDWTDGRS